MSAAPRVNRWIGLAAVLLAGSAASQAPAPPSPPANVTLPSTAAAVELIFTDAYPLEASVSFAVGLLHWVDSLAGTSGGKTVPQYRAEFYTTFGGLSDEDKAALRAFRDVRIRHARRNGVNDGDRGAPSLLGTFLEAEDLDSAVRSSGGQLSPADVAALRASLTRFDARYRQLWLDGAVPRAFVAQARADPSRAELAALLAKIAKFFGVDPRRTPYPRIVLVPVPPGGGTHAEAVGRSLLIEIRAGETLSDESPPIVHENSHFLWYRMDEAKNDRLREKALEITGNDDAWRLLHEALPTALGQGVAARAFLRSRWSPNVGWYHTEDVDRFAKQIYPEIQKAMNEGSPFDAALLSRILHPARSR